MEAKYTPGPWRVGQRIGRRVDVWSRGTRIDFQIAEAFDHPATVGYPEYANADANARLIAAAPDMVEELRRLARWMRQSDLLTTRPQYERVQKLLATIDGKAVE